MRQIPLSNKAKVRSILNVLFNPFQKQLFFLPLQGKANWYRLILPVFFTCLAVSSCQKVIDLKLTNAAARIVIEGNVTNQPGEQVVKISQTVPFSSTNVFPPVSGATVSINDDQGHSLTFPEGPAGTYSLPNIVATQGRTYTMTVQCQGITYTATSTMPQQVMLDSLGVKNSVFKGKNGKDVSAYFMDPAGVANQYRFVMYVNGTEVQRTFAYNDQFFDGRTVGVDLFEDDITIKSKDTVTVEMQCIDPNVYTYWYSLEQQQVQGPGGGTTPSNPPGNITNNALGYFSAHTSQAMIMVVP